MKRSQRLQVVLDLNLRKEDEAREQLAQANARLAQENQRLEDLRQYQGEYQQALRSQNKNTSAVQYQSYVNFINQLSLAIEQQQLQIQQVQQLVAGCRQAWSQAHQKRKGMSDLIDRCRKQETLASDRLEQKAMDEITLSRMGRSGR